MFTIFSSHASESSQLTLTKGLRSGRISRHMLWYVDRSLVRTNRKLTTIAEAKYGMGRHVQFVSGEDTAMQLKVGLGDPWLRRLLHQKLTQP